MVINIGKDTIFKGWLKVGKGLNTRDELVWLWSLLFCEKSWGVSSLQILGDSQFIINWAKGEAQVKSLVLHHWMERIKCLMKYFSLLSFHNIHGEMNVEDDTL